MGPAFGRRRIYSSLRGLLFENLEKFFYIENYMFLYLSEIGLCKTAGTIDLRVLGIGFLTSGNS